MAQIRQWFFKNKEVLKTLTYMVSDSNTHETFARDINEIFLVRNPGAKLVSQNSSYYY